MSDAELMAAALFGLDHRRSGIEEQIAYVRLRLRNTDLSGSVVPGRKKRTFSAAARRRIVAAQRKRWAKFRAKKHAKKK